MRSCFIIIFDQYFFNNTFKISCVQCDSQFSIFPNRLIISSTDRISIFFGAAVTSMDKCNFVLPIFSLSWRQRNGANIFWMDLKIRIVITPTTSNRRMAFKCPRWSMLIKSAFSMWVCRGSVRISASAWVKSYVFYGRAFRRGTNEFNKKYHRRS